MFGLTKEQKPQEEPAQPDETQRKLTDNNHSVRDIPNDKLDISEIITDGVVSQPVELIHAQPTHGYGQRLDTFDPNLDLAQFDEEKPKQISSLKPISVYQAPGRNINKLDSEFLESK